MKVLQVIDSFSYGGAERLLASLNGVAAETGLELTAASLAPYTAARTASLPMLTEAGLQPSFIGVRRLLDPAAVRLLTTAIRASGCAVVHAHLGYSATLVPVAARRAGVPCFSTLHHVPRPGKPARARLKEWLSVSSAERGAGLIFVSEAARRAAAEHVKRPRASWMVVHNGVDLSAFHPPVGDGPEPLPTDLGVPAGAPVVALVAALRPDKGHEVALRAWPIVRSRIPDAVLLVVGDGGLRAELHGLAGDGVVFAGAREDVPVILRGCTLSVLPSLREALPTAIIEAAATGLPTVATPVGGIPETLQDGRTGLLVTPGDVAELADAVITLLADSQRRATFGRAARRLAEGNFDLRRWARRLSELYQWSAAAQRDAVVRST